MKSDIIHNSDAQERASKYKLKLNEWRKGKLEMPMVADVRQCREELSKIAPLPEEQIPLENQN